MDLSFTAEEAAFRSEVRAWLSQHVDPNWRDQCPDLAALSACHRKWDRTLFEGGWGAIEWPKEFGGRDASAVESAIFVEEHSRLDAPEGPRVGKQLVGPTIMQYGTDEQKQHLKKIIAGEEVWCQGFSEPEAGSDLGSLRTSAELRSDGWHIDGRKVWTSFARFADWCYLLARVGSPELGAQGITVFLLDMKTPGITVVPLRNAAGISKFNEVLLEDVIVPEDAVLGPVGGWSVVRSALKRERGSDFSFRRFITLRRAMERFLDIYSENGDDTHSLATIGRVYAKAFGAQLLAIELLAMESAGELPDSFGSLAKLYSTETWRRQAFTETTELDRRRLDALSFEQEEEWTFDFLESMHYTISGGTSEIQKNALSRSLFGLPSSKAR